MSDKRKTPGPPDDAPRRKRPTPTIDLTATEVPAEAMDDGPPSEPPPAQSQPEAADDFEAASVAGRNSSFQRPVWLNAAGLAGGLFGAAVVAIVLAALWFAGVLPVRYAASTNSSDQVVALEKQVRDLQNRPGSASGSQIDALAQRVTKIEGMLAKLPANDPSVSERLSAADNAMKSLGIVLTALNKRNDEVAAGAADARARADAAEKAVTQLRDSVRDLTRNTSAGLSPADVDTVQKRLAALEQSVKSSPADSAARLALSAAALRDLVSSGAPFVAELEEVKSLGADEKILAPLTPFAMSGVPTVAALAQDLRALIPAMQKASGAQAPPSGFLERLEANAGKLVRIRPVDAPPGDDASAVLARVEIEAAHAAIDDALTDLGKLDTATRAPAQDWIRKAQARQAALTAARQLASETTHALGKQ